MMFIRPTPPMPERKRADEAHQDLQSQSDDLELVHLRHQVEHSHRLAVGLVELVLHGQNGAHRSVPAARTRESGR